MSSSRRGSERSTVATWRRGDLATWRLAVAFALLLPATLPAQTDARLVDAVRIAQEGASDSARGIVSRLLAATAPTDTLYPEALYTLGLVSRSVEDMRRSYTRVALEYGTSSWADDALYRLGLLDYAAGNLASASRQFDRIRSDYPESGLLAATSEWAARALFDQKKPQDACAWLSLGREIDSTDVELATRLDFLNGRCLNPPPVPVAADSSPRPPVDTAPRPGATRKGFGVQIGAVNTQAAADKLVNDLRGAGFTGYVVLVGKLYKVRAGPWPDRAKAAEASGRIKAKLGGSPFVVPEP